MKTYSEIRQEIKSKTTDRKVPVFEPNYDNKAWARILKKRHEAGEKISSLKIAMYREALRIGDK